MTGIADSGDAHMWRTIPPEKKPLFRPTGKRGFTFVELLVACIILSILVGLGVGAFHFVIARAYKVTMKHDLQNFAKAQEAYTIQYGGYLGGAGDYIQWGSPPSGPLAVPDLPFTPSKWVRVEIVSGNGQTHVGPQPFKAVATHERSRVYFEYDFSSRIITEKER
jgi:prepilin-type N-terminal cleavage/methylation domain-containing protein